MKKLSLNQLKVKSFVTAVNDGNNAQTIKGGLSGGACVPVEAYPVDIRAALATRGGCTQEHMC